MLVTSQHQVADIFTKPLGRVAFEFLMSKINLFNLYLPLEGEYYNYTKPPIKTIDR
jgi:hypothetical protein